MASETKLVDPSTLSNPNEVIVTHLDWDVKVDFQSHTLQAQATYTYRRIDRTAKTLCLDTAHLKIKSVKSHAGGKRLSYKLHAIKVPDLGRKLEITLPKEDDKLTILYSTTTGSTALQWLPPSQTAGKVHPYLLMQCQAIHARSMLPCQDCPGVKMTYNATATVPSWAACVFSALPDGDPVSTSETEKTFKFRQPVPISSYLVALAVGDLAKVDVSDRCAIWSEPSLIDAAAFEFAQTEDFLKAAEDLAGTPYIWGRYDLLCLPPSFPFGGMENPCLTFVTPTLLAGDRSLSFVVAHEISHSWTGNLVTNLTWDHFWLNEGWTVWLERKIMSRIYKNDKYLDFDAIGGYKDLQESIKVMPKEYTKLVWSLGEIDPDEAYSTVPYEKGFNLLFALETRVGTVEFEKFFQSYVKDFSYKTITSEQFKAYFLKYFEGNEKIRDFDWDKWYYSEGMPPETPKFDKTLAEAPEKLASMWYGTDQNGRMLPSTNIKTWTSQEVIAFLDRLHELSESTSLKLSTIYAINKAYNFSESQNSEILFRFSRMAIEAGDETILPVVVRFITTQGRLKFVRPLYRALSASKMGKTLAIDTFLQHQDFYHPIGAKMIAMDLKMNVKGTGAGSTKFWWLAAGAAGAATVGIVLLRSRRK